MRLIIFNCKLTGFLLPHEMQIIERLIEKLDGPKYYVPIVWAGAIATKYALKLIIFLDYALSKIPFYLVIFICDLIEGKKRRKN